MKTPKKILITGSMGFTGKYLRPVLESAGHEVIGLDKAVNALAGTDKSQTNLLNSATIGPLMRSVQPDVVVHLAGMAFAAEKNIFNVYDTNAMGTLNLLMAIEENVKKPQLVILASSAAVYDSSGSMPITENTRTQPVNHYGSSKLAMEIIAQQFNLPITVVRAFNYTGVGQSEKFLVPKLVDHFKNSSGSIKMGNLFPARDYSDVRDVANSYKHIIEHNITNETLNICSGDTFSVIEILELLTQISGRQLDVEQDPALLRANEPPLIQGSEKKLQTLISTELKKIPFIETLSWMYSAD